MITARPGMLAPLLACDPAPPPPEQRVAHPLGALFAKDDNGSGSLDPSELRCTEPEDLRARLDTDSDGGISPAELRADLDLWPEDLSRSARHAAPRAEGEKPPRR